MLLISQFYQFGHELHQRDATRKKASKIQRKTHRQKEMQQQQRQTSSLTKLLEMEKHQADSMISTPHSGSRTFGPFNKIIF